MRECGGDPGQASYLIVPQVEKVWGMIRQNCSILLRQYLPAEETMMKPFMTTILLWVAVLAVHADDSPKTTAAKEPQLRSELLLRTDKDQAVRKALIGWMKKHGSSGNVVDESLSPEL